MLALMSVAPKPRATTRVTHVAGTASSSRASNYIAHLLSGEVDQAAIAIRSVDFNLAGLPPGGVRGE